MHLSSFYKCSLFDSTIDNINNFSFIQQELLLANERDLSKFEKISVEYKCSFSPITKLGSKPVAIICTKDSSVLMRHTLGKIKKYNLLQVLDFVIVDDRSTENIKQICDEFNVSYLRVDNNKGFNFSSLNNIAAKLAYDAGCDTIILWNNDLWPEDLESVKSLINLHKINNSTISGTKLLYPLEPWNGDNNPTENIKQHFLNKKDSYRGTVQFGGGLFIFTPQNNIYSPIHYKRFADKNDPYVNVNKPDVFVTGAFQIIDLNWFIKIGGLNPSLSKNFQDVDLCLKAVEDKKTVFYFGKDINLFHDESATITKEKKIDKQFISDNILYAKIWNMHKFLTSIYALE